MRCDNCTNPGPNVSPRHVRASSEPKHVRPERQNLCSLCAVEARFFGDDVEPVTPEDVKAHKENDYV
jgi:hypothetical protein